MLCLERNNKINCLDKDNSLNCMKNFFQNIIANVFNDLPRKYAAWLEAIEEQDDLLALQSASRGLEAVLSDADLPIGIRTRIIEIATQKTRPILRKVNQQFIRFEYMDSSIESNMLSIVYGFHKALYANCLSLLDDVIANPVGYDNKAIHTLLAEIVNQIFEMMKWRSYVNLGLSPKVWLQLHKIYDLALDNDLLDKTLEADEAETENPALAKPTLAAQLVQTYMLDSLQQANLSRQGIVIVCKILQQQLLHAEISQEFNPIKYLFYVDREKDAGAKRIRHFTPTDSCIYWQIDELEKKFSIVLDRSTSNPALTAWCASLAIEPHQAKAVPETLSALLREWSRREYRRQRRKEDRKKLTTTASVVYGIQNVCERVRVYEDKKLMRGARLSADGRSLDERLRNHAIIKGEDNKLKDERSDHHWVIVDESNRGLGAVASSEFNNWITVGQLVGLVVADSQPNMVVAILRSSRPKANRQIQVGMEILSRHAKWVQLEIISTPASGGAFDPATHAQPRTFAGLYLPIEAGISTESSLLLPKIEFMAHAQYQISIAGMLESVTLDQAQDTKDDWVQVVYPR